MGKKGVLFLFIFGLLSITIIGSISIILVYNLKREKSTGYNAISPELEKFKSEEDFREYFLQNSTNSSIYAPMGSSFSGESGSLQEFPDTISSDLLDDQNDYFEDSSRISETNVQVEGIDEPDIVKTDGTSIYFSSEYSYYPLMDGPILLEESSPSSMETDSVTLEKVDPSDVEIYGDDIYTPKTKIIQAIPVENISELSQIEDYGQLLIFKNVLIILGYDHIYGYNISDKSNPTKIWNIELNGSFLAARLYNDKLYLITSEYIDSENPCPVEPVVYGDETLSIKCNSIYHPTVYVPVDSTYSAMIINPESGTIDNSISFVGSSGSSVIYMSPNSLYVTYTYYGDFLEFSYNFLNESADDIFPSDLIEKVNKLRGYDISYLSKLNELQFIFDNYLSSLEGDRRMELEDKLDEKMDRYMEEHKRELQKTGITKIDLNNLEITANGNVPGTPLNQFSLDEYNNNLRIAVTNSNWLSGSSANVSDVYVLNQELEKRSEVLDLGKGEIIYSVRFIEDKGYVVTFKQMDPFYVLDLKDPDNASLEGELKIPGYSSYLHPISESIILGIGQEDSKVKLSLFDVSNPSNPTEVSKYLLDDYWTEVSSNHHAFLMDRDNQIFFVPGSMGGYIFSYSDNNLNLIKLITDTQVQRAVYIDNFLYVIGSDKISVLDESNWEIKKELIFE